MNDFLGSLGGLSPLLAVAANPEGAAALGVTWTEATPTVYNFTIPADLDGDGAADGQFQGSATFERAPSEGLIPGDAVRILWNLAGHPRLTGEGDIEVRLAADGIELSGQIEFEDSSGDCSFSFVVAELLPLDIQIPGVWPPAVSADGGAPSLSVAGSGNASARAGGNTLSARLAFTGNSADATNITATVGGVQQTLPNQNFPFGNAPPPEASRLAAWIGTWDISYACARRDSGGSFTGREVFVITALSDTRLQVDFEDLGDGTTDRFEIDLFASPTEGTFNYNTRTNENGGFTERGTYRLEKDANGALTRLRKNSMFGPWKRLTDDSAEGDCTITSSTKR